MTAKAHTRLSPLLITGGLQRPEAEAMVSTSGNHYFRARLSRLNWTDKSETVLMDYETPQGARPDETPGIRFTAMTLQGDRLYLCTGTEVFVYTWPELERLQYSTHPHFHDIHHVAPMNGGVTVASTGLDMVIELDDSLAPKRYVNTVSDDPWFKYDPEDDWRKVHSTQPHDAHPNYLLSMNGEPWVTRGYQSDVMRLADRRTVSLSDKRVHDGHVVGDHAFFTSVDGRIIVLNTHTLAIDEVVDLMPLEGTELPLGWCRGLHVDGDVAYVGFTTLRTTKWKDNVEHFLNSRTGEYKQVLPSRVVAYDLKKRIKLDEYVIPRESIGAVFDVVAIPDWADGDES
ncbi:hypothetical protein [Desulfovibrio oxyclinae]|uniref:hypothetical protein n=1 Tax=Desulfovibrio oxyclinae TaxID=63560 RepID=UPI0003809D16|nr:hypothetical protein [Desulfovibrio oxyclinae]